MNPPVRLLIATQEHFHKAAEWLIDVPGREMWVAAQITNDYQYAITVPDLNAHTIFDRRGAKSKKTVRNRPLPRWARQIAGVLLVLSDEGLAVPGVKVILLGDEPPGPRYEHALGMGFAALWYVYNQQTCDLNCLMDLMERVRKEYLD